MGAREKTLAPRKYCCANLSKSDAKSKSARVWRESKYGEQGGGEGEVDFTLAYEGTVFEQ